MTNEKRIRAAYFLRSSLKSALDVVTHPLTLCVATCALALSNSFSLIVLLMGFVAPVCVGLAMRLAKKITFYWAPRSKHDRLLILMINLTFYVALIALCNRVGVPRSVKIIPLIQTVIMLVSAALLIANKSIVNEHFATPVAYTTYAVSIAVFSGITMTEPVILLILLIGAKSYLWINMHQTTGREVAASTLLGIVAAALCIWLVSI